MNEKVVSKKSVAGHTRRFIGGLFLGVHIRGHRLVKHNINLLRFNVYRFLYINTIKVIKNKEFSTPTIKTKK